MAVLILKREKAWVNYFRRYKVYIDGDLAETIRNGETRRLHLESGEHTIQLRIEWCGSPPVKFTLDEGAIKVFRIEAIETGRLANAIMAFLLILFFLIPSPLQYLPWFLKLGLVVSAILLVIYHATLGRDNFIEIIEEKPAGEGTEIGRL